MTATTSAPSKGMGRSVAIVAVVVVVVALIAGYYFLYGMGSGSKTTTTSATTHIAIPSGTGASQALNFSPQTVKVVIGINNTVTWTNNDNTNHTIIFDSAPSGVSLTSLTDPNNLVAGNSYSVTLSTAGTYQFHCEIHSWMHGTITVAA